MYSEETHAGVCAVLLGEKGRDSEPASQRNKCLCALLMERRCYPGGRERTFQAKSTAYIKKHSTRIFSFEANFIRSEIKKKTFHYFKNYTL